jgi:hypothetical protein
LETYFSQCLVTSSIISRLYNLQFIRVHSLLHTEPIRYTWIAQCFILFTLLLLDITEDYQEFMERCLTFPLLIQKDSCPRRSLQEIFRGGPGALAHHQVALTQLENPLEISTKGRDEPVVRNLPKVISRTLLSRVNSSDIPLRGASSSSTPAEGALTHLASGVGRFHLAGPKIYECAKWKRKKARASQAGTGTTQEPENAGILKQGKISTRTSKKIWKGSDLQEGPWTPVDQEHIRRR